MTNGTVSDVIVDNIRTGINSDDGDVIKAAEKKLKAARIAYDPTSLRIRKKSVDARHSDNITFVSSVICGGYGADEYRTGDISVKPREAAELVRGNEPMNGRPCIVGFGPAGIFAGLLLAENGLAPVIFEKGAAVDERVRKVEEFYASRKLDVNTNIQFGAGGAGTFSDGKLVTRIGDRRTSYVLEKFHELGAPEDILWKAKPHVGTDILRSVIKNAAERIKALGGEIVYNTTVENVGDGWVVVNGEKTEVGPVIIAPGHSSRDFISNLAKDGFKIEAKPFSVGVRIEHHQSELDAAMYKDASLCEKLGHAEYQLSFRKGERGVYTFCMCPGGEVMAAASEEGGVVTNGMSRRARDGRNANSALVVSVLPDDFGGSPESAIEFQRSLERAAFAAGGRDYSAPAQTVKAFNEGRAESLPDIITPSYMGGRVVPCDFNKLLPGFVTSMMKEGLASFGRKIKGFSADYVPMTGLETRTSSPVRILREDDYTAVGFDCVYPCGEGAGYAGGITSAAVDGLRVAEAILARYK